MDHNLEPTYSVVSNPLPGSGRLQVLFTGSSQTRPAHRSGPKVVDYYLIHYVESGYGVFAYEGSEYSLGPGDSFVIEPGVLASYTADESVPWRYRWIAFKGEEACELMAAAGLTRELPTVHVGGGRRGRAVRLCFERVRAAFAATAAAGRGLRVDAYLRLLLAEYADSVRAAGSGDGGSEPADGGPDAGADRLVRAAIHYLSAQYAEPISIELMAESLGYNRAYVSRLFKRHTGVSPVTFLLRLRLDRARRLLRERSELTVEQVASSVGFQDALYFSKQFRRAYGQSPTEYRAEVSRG
ncbi:AraC family transcriptional regulator [Paenibacillus thermotolerans]|uniref:AraC family transcriptional regulator n=1 Tax=Paenibacillus thermotolerans TaxID=3027807 RepID=UPI0023679CF0|nr:MULTISPECIES: AraC family transcriptional regulator [unclassified Paenibacillus]